MHALDEKRVPCNASVILADNASCLSWFLRKGSGKRTKTEKRNVLRKKREIIMERCFNVVKKDKWMRYPNLLGMEENRGKELRPTRHLIASY